MRLSRLLLATLGATALLGALVGHASARTLSTTSQTFRATFASLGLRTVFGEIRCGPVTLEGSLHASTMSKVAGALVGYVTRAAMGEECAVGRATVLRETLPWHVRYAFFSGTLPNITSVSTNVIGFAFRYRESLISCLGTSTVEEPLVLSLRREVASRALTTAELGGSIPSDCGSSFGFSGASASLTVVNSATRITVTLI
jgi:hypothetical protein